MYTYEYVVVSSQVSATALKEGYISENNYSLPYIYDNFIEDRIETRTWLCHTKGKLCPKREIPGKNV